MAPIPLSVVIHGHFYQPPREDPWLELVPPQPSAAPWHDWNERIERECYRTVVASRLLDGDGRVRGFLNCLSRMSFNVGPTLMQWLEDAAPQTYARILAADRESAERLGHGNALAMPFHHPILPLADPRDRSTEIRWGMEDFRRRFGREPEGMWLPETAVDPATMEALGDAGIRFTILAPHQVTPVPVDGRPGRYVTRAGRELAVFVYDGTLSHDVAFGDLLKDGAVWADRIREDAAADRGGRWRLRSVATDGETFGHHHPFGEMALATAFDRLATRTDVVVENFASFLARNPPDIDVQIVGPSSWSCAHGVERWRSNCGCRADPSVATDQSWRTPLRQALSWLADALHDRFESETAALLADPWAARDAYADVIGSGAADTRAAFLARVRSRPLIEPEERRVFELLEMERNALRLFTSCAWFFDDVAGIEARQVLSYAARAIELSDDAVRLETGFLEQLADALSNDPEAGAADRVYLEVRPSAPREIQVAAAAAIAAAHGGPFDGTQAWGAYEVVIRDGGVRLEHRTTGQVWELGVELGGAALPERSVRVTTSDRPEGRVVSWLELPAILRERVAERLIAVSLGSGSVATAGRDRRAIVVGHLNAALAEQIAVIEDDPRQSAAPGSAERILLILDALAALAEGVPFESETSLWLLVSGDGPGGRLLQPVRARLAFAPVP